MGPEQAQRLRVLSFNINGLRACLKRLGITLPALLAQLQADVVCFQETKLRRCDVERDLAVVEGWDSFFACSQSARGYSGVATFVRTATALPFAAEEGFTGCAPTPATAAGNGGAAPAEFAVPHPALAEQYSIQELTELDSEGRVLITDHGAFVLFNIYGPAITIAETAEDRLQFKMRFYQALELRWQDLLQRGRAVVAVGDFNICPAPIDYPDADPHFYRPSRPERLWLRRLLAGSNRNSSYGGSLPGSQSSSQPGSPLAAGAPAAGGAANFSWDTATGAAAAIASTAAHRSSGGGGGGSGRDCRFVDTFRHFHPNRQAAFTCWSTATSARVTNYGSRIDLVLTAGLSVGQPPAAAAQNTLAQAGAAAAAPAAATMAGAAGATGPSHALWPAVAGDGGAGSSFVGGGHSSSGSSMRSPATVWVAGGDIWPEQQGSDHCPVWADFGCCGAPFPCAVTAPAAATRHVFGGKQLKLHTWLQRGNGAGVGRNGCGSLAAAAAAREVSPEAAGTQCGLQAQAAAAAAAEAAAAGGAGPDSPADPEEQQQQQQSEPPDDLPSGSGLADNGSSSMGPAAASQGAAAAGQPPQAAPAVAAAATVAAAAGPAGKKQASLRSFFRCPPQQQQQPQQPAWQQQQQQPQDVQQQQRPPAQQQQQRQASSGPAEQQQGQQLKEPAPGRTSSPGTHGFIAAELEAAAASRQQAAAVAKDAWRSIQQRYQVPKCQHGEPAVLKRVNKSGPNHGRFFYTCGRPDGPKPEHKCNYFKWVEKRPGDHSLTTLSSNVSSGGSSAAAAGSKRLKP